MEPTLLKRPPSPTPAAPSSLHNYTEYPLLDSQYGLLPTLKWQLDFGNPSLQEFGELPGYEIPRYIRSSPHFLPSRSHFSPLDSLILTEIDRKLGLPTPPKPPKTPRIHHIKWTNSVEFSLSGGSLSTETRYLNRSKELNKVLNEDPKDVKTWLELVNLQEKSISGRNGKNQIIEKQVCMIDKALLMISGKITEENLAILLRKIAILGKNSIEISIFHHNEAYLNFPLFWFYAIYIQNRHFDTFSMSNLRLSFKSAFLFLQNNPDFDKIRLKLLFELAEYELIVRIA